MKAGAKRRFIGTLGVLLATASGASAVQDDIASGTDTAGTADCFCLTGSKNMNNCG